MSDTRKEFVEELEHLLAHCKPGATKRHLVVKIIEQAKRGKFRDFKSDYAAPKILLGCQCFSLESGWKVKRYVALPLPSA